MKRLILLATLAACGDDPVAKGEFAIVGHNDLGARGMNSALAIAGTTAYVGSRIDSKPVAILDISDPANPTVVGEIGSPDEGLAGLSSRELRAVDELNLLVILNLQCSPDLHGCAPGVAEVENLKFYDITDRLHPRFVEKVVMPRTGLVTPSPHELFLWRDPNDPARVVVYLAAPGPAAFFIYDVAAATPTQILRWDPVAMGGLPRGGTDNILHSVAVSDDGRTGYLSHQTSGLVVVDLSTIADRAATPDVTMITPAAQALKFGVMGPHSAVPVPGKPLLFVTEEIYPPPFGAGCPWGHARLVDIADPTKPTIVGEYKLPENDAACTADAPLTSFTAHNATVTKDLALVTWYAGGLQAVDISDPTQPKQLAELRPEPLAAVAVEDPGLGGNPIEMWSYPVIQDGIIWVVDTRNGLYSLRYTGTYEDELTSLHFAEGNSNLH